MQQGGTATPTVEEAAEAELLFLHQGQLQPVFLQGKSRLRSPESQLSDSQTISVVGTLPGWCAPDSGEQLAIPGDSGYRQGHVNQSLGSCGGLHSPQLRIRWETMNESEFQGTIAQQMKCTGAKHSLPA